MRSKFEIIREWLDKAEHDHVVAKLTKDHIPEYHEIIAFHCQQAVEKNLKGLLIFYNVDPERTHDLLYLCEVISRFKEIPERIS